MMPTAHKSSLLLSEENVNPLKTTNISTEYESTNQIQSANSQSSSCRSSSNDDERNGTAQNNDKASKILNDSTNNNHHHNNNHILYCLIKDSTIKNSNNSKDFVKDVISRESKDVSISSSSNSSSSNTSIPNTSIKDWSRLNHTQIHDSNTDQTKELIKDTNSLSESKDHLKSQSTIREPLPQKKIDTQLRSISTETYNRENQQNNTTSDQKIKRKKYSNNKNRDSSSSNCSLGVHVKDNEPLIKEWKFSKTHQKRFKRRFPDIEPDEQLIDWFSCALIADILLQGYLYISEHYIAFYSNIFGYKTHVLVKISDVYLITKEKTARLFPNAVGIHTKNDKFVFGSLLSREKTFELLNEVRSSYLIREKQTTTDPSDDDLPVDSTLKSNDISNDSSNDTLHSNGSIKHHTVDEHSKLDSLKRNQRRSSSLKMMANNSGKETIDNNLAIVNSRRQSKLLNETERLNLDQILFKLSSFKSLLRFEFKSSKSSFLIISIGFLLLLLLVSISILIVRINSAHDKLISMSKHASPNMNMFNEMFQVMKIMKHNLNEISRLKDKLN